MYIHPEKGRTSNLRTKILNKLPMVLEILNSFLKQSCVVPMSIHFLSLDQEGSFLNPLF